jgi:hypothetical protein
VYTNLRAPPEIDEYGKSNMFVLWPATRASLVYLYAATNDLRKVLVDLPGVRLCLGDNGYGLRFDDNVELNRTISFEAGHTY